MASCELCGNSNANARAEIEGTTMNVCAKCSKFGRIVGGNIKIVVREKRHEDSEPTIIFLKNYGQILKSAREKLGLKQEELAKRINERESTLHQIESEHFKPGIELARKLERTLQIKILEEIKDDDLSGNKFRTKTQSSQSGISGAVTIGDLINIRK